MRGSILIILFVLLASCKSPETKSVQKDTVQKQVAVKKDTATFSQPFVKDLYAKSDLVVRVKVLGAVKNQDFYVVSANLISTYKGKADTTSPLKYEAFLEEGDYKEFYGKDLIVFLNTNKHDPKLFAAGVRWGRIEANVEFAYSEELNNYILKLK
ncbi:hypothetical protein [Mucilaginibacter jinjuensis]|uniref:Lipoprotein n=1 Tax=Mucilaginibacter jinjuensis TaxID=1176721 RepID=A0ABY7T4Y8_9SPHI|nr:hypothetical protein [Mucilaginibacter jinjuensis]WCT11308.1 hypothetical protein PQO05_21450 [Mucilaginibacter jinjuensis]